MGRSDLTRDILAEFEAAPQGAVLGPEELSHLGSPGAVEQALARLADAGELSRAGRAAYALPPPGPPELWRRILAESLGRHEGAVVAPDGRAMAEQLGLTAGQIAEPVYLTSGHDQLLYWGEEAIELQHAPSWQLLLPRRPAGEAIRALAWLGPDFAEAAMYRLAGILTDSDKAELAGVQDRLPEWMSQAVSGLIEHPTKTPAPVPAGVRPESPSRESAVPRPAPQNRSGRRLSLGRVAIAAAAVLVGAFVTTGVASSAARAPAVVPKPTPVVGIIPGGGRANPLSGTFAPGATRCGSGPAALPGTCTFPLSLRGRNRIVATWTGSGPLALKLTDTAGGDVTPQITGDHGMTVLVTGDLPAESYRILVVDTGDLGQTVGFALALSPA